MKTLLTASFLFLSVFARAENCQITIEGNDQMKYNLSKIEVPSDCPKFTVELKHVGKLGKNIMGHNWVLLETKNEQALIKESLTQGPAKDYLNPSSKYVLFHTKMVAGGESDKVEVDISKLDKKKQYQFICTFPGHASIMKGPFIIK
jgi:azurin